MKISKLMYGLLAVMLGVSLVGSTIMLRMISKSEPNGSVINYAGIVRGGAQRTAKLYLLQSDTTKAAATIDDIIKGLIEGDAEKNLPPAQSEDFYNQMIALKTVWDNEFRPALTEELTPEHAAKFKEITERFFQMANDAVFAAQQIHEQAMLRINIMFVVIVLVTIICFCAIFVVVRKKILLPLHNLDKDVQQISSGDLSVEITYHAKGEIGSLAHNIRHMTRNLRCYIDRIRCTLYELAQGNLDVEHCSGFQGDFITIEQSLNTIISAMQNMVDCIGSSTLEVSRGAEVIAQTSQELTQSAGSQIDSLENLNRSIHEISDSIHQMENGTAAAKDSMQKINLQIDACGKQMEKMLEAMGLISHSSEGIGKVTKSIEDIAFQTNILALNAAVEAARAGAVGKGFAVVADEVRSLANKSAESAQNTSDLVLNSISNVQDGQNIANTTAQMLKQVIDMVAGASSAVEEITAASALQTVSIQEIAREVDSINNVFVQRTRMTESSAAATEELASQANTLKGLVDQFRYRQSEQTLPARTSSELTMPSL